MIGLDTCFLIDLLNKDAKAAQFVEQNGELCLCGEVLYEFLKGRLTSEHERRFLEFVTQIPVLAFDTKAAIRAAEIYRSRQRQGKSLASADVAIAASYGVHGVTQIVTRNAKHFDGIPGLSVLTY